MYVNNNSMSMFIGSIDAKFELAFHSCLCENFVDGKNLAYSHTETDLGLALR